MAAVVGLTFSDGRSQVVVDPSDIVGTTVAAFTSSDALTSNLLALKDQRVGRVWHCGGLRENLERLAAGRATDVVGVAGTGTGGLVRDLVETPFTVTVSARVAAGELPA